jgi:23S rRNA pseudouridine2605 synthase
MRLNQFIASSSGLSRRAADEAISQNRVTIDGEPAKLGQAVGQENIITLDGNTLKPKTTYTYLALNKPAGYVSSRAQQSSAPTLYKLIPEQYKLLRITGRLDQDSSGLILLSDDGAFIQNLAHPSYGKTKQYDLTLSAPLTPEHKKELETGVPLRDGTSRVKILASAGRRVTVTIGEGRNRQLRRTFGALGLAVERLHRTRIGRIGLGNLRPGDWRLLTANEDSDEDYI